MYQWIKNEVIFGLRYINLVSIIAIITIDIVSIVICVVPN